MFGCHHLSLSRRVLGPITSLLYLSYPGASFVLGSFGLQGTKTDVLPSLYLFSHVLDPKLKTVKKHKSRCASLSAPFEFDVESLRSEEERGE